MIDKGPDQVRGDDTDKPDRARESDRRPCGQTCPEHHVNSLAAEIDADATRRVFSQSECRQTAAIEKQNSAPRRKKGKRKTDFIKATIGDRAEHPIDHV